MTSALPDSDDQSGSYDRLAGVYDRVVGNRTYNRLAWGTEPGDYAGFAAEAVAAGDGLFLEAGSGSATFTADAYRAARRPIVLVDRSLDMLARAAGRITGAPAALMQADVLDLPFQPARFDTVACFGLLHILDDLTAALNALREQLAPGGHLYASMLVADRRVGRHYLAALHRAGEVAPPRRMDDLTRAAEAVFGGAADVTRTGSMAWLRVANDGDAAGTPHRASGPPA